ncbi:hypothetical protein V6N11_051288 [Hibiscus sabdariffa]|uniref:Uncharacterized protein n=2 Tax=Hibiscus sabdariffa TaxID=183260 RepID=A0ABR2ADK8_9ROSI
MNPFRAVSMETNSSGSTIADDYEFLTESHSRRNLQGRTTLTWRESNARRAVASCERAKPYRSCLPTVNARVTVSVQGVVFTNGDVKKL